MSGCLLRRFLWLRAGRWTCFITWVVSLGFCLASAAAEPRVHEVAAGETLWTIAESNLGDAYLWPALYRANRDQIVDPAVVYPGQRLTLPEVKPEEREQVRSEALNLLAE